MNKLWQLKNIKTNETLNEPQKLPENWGPIFGLHGFEDKLGDLSWLGSDYTDLGWVIVGEAPDAPLSNITPSKAVDEWEKAKGFLRESDWSVLSDVPMTSGEKADWIEYRRQLREIRLQEGFPDNINWPIKPS